MIIQVSIVLGVYFSRRIWRKTHQQKSLEAAKINLSNEPIASHTSEELAQIGEDAISLHDQDATHTRRDMGKVTVNPEVAGSSPVTPAHETPLL